jgi:H+/Cl- antiporter ClcA
MIGSKLFERISGRVWDKIPFEAIPLWIAAVFTGLIAVLYEKLFSVCEYIAEEIFKFNPYLIFLSAPVFMFSGWFLVNKYEKNAGGSGIPQLMAAVELAGTKNAGKVNILLNLRVIVVKILSSLFMLLGGGAIGREGPTLQVAGSIYQIIYRYIPGTWTKVSQRIMIITGGASGLAAAFNTPLGGIVYVVEELTKSHIGTFRTAVFTAVIISGLTAQLFLGSYLYLGFPRIGTIQITAIFWVVLLAFISGFAGSLFSKFLLKIDEWRSRIKKPYQKLGVILLLSLAFAGLVFFTGIFTMGSGKPLMNAILFDARQQPWYIFPARFFGAVLTFSIGGAGGIFATSLSSGASLGSLLVNLLSIPHSYHNLLVLVSMIGFLTGVTRSPFTASILVLEMTDRHSAIFYFLLAGIVANLGASQVLSKSFYEIRKLSIVSTLLDSKKSK